MASTAAVYNPDPTGSATNSTRITQKLTRPNSDIIKIICAVVLPPLGVFLERGCGADLLINLLLTILGCKSLPSSPLSFGDHTLTNPPSSRHPRHHPRPVHHS